jgi:biotin carboxyl carrier protein
MKLTLKINGLEQQVEVERRGSQAHFSINDREIPADVTEVTPGVYSILLGGEAFEARVESQLRGLRVHIGWHEYAVEIIDPRQWRRDRGSSAEAEGRQQLVAPMPGKIVHLLVSAGQAVEAGQGLVVVEAMKMQNEIKSPKAGKVEKLIAREGQAVSAGDTLVIIS